MKSRSGIDRTRKQKQEISIPQAKTIKEANELAVQLGLAKRAEFKGISLEHANLMISELARIKQEFPQIETLSYMGISTGYTRMRRYSYAGIAIGSYNIPRAFLLNSGYFTSKNDWKLKLGIENDARSDYHPKGTATVKGIIDHEIGHLLDYSYSFKGIRNDSRIQKLFKKYHDNDGSKMKSVLSQYANTTAAEFIAEGWSEYRNSSNPRPVAREIGKIVTELYSQK